MKKIWLLLFAIVLGGCNMSDSANEASVENETETKEFTLTVNNLTDEDYEFNVPDVDGNKTKYSVKSKSSVTVKEISYISGLGYIFNLEMKNENGSIGAVLTEPLIIDAAITVDFIKHASSMSRYEFSFHNA